MANQQELIQELSQKYEYSKDLDDKVKVVEKEMSELETFELHLKEIDQSKDKHMLASLGKGVYIPTDITNKKLFVDVGAGILTRKTPAEAQKVISGQLKRLQEMRLLLGHTIETINQELQDLVAQIEEKN